MCFPYPTAPIFAIFRPDNPINSDHELCLLVPSQPSRTFSASSGLLDADRRSATHSLCHSLLPTPAAARSTSLNIGADFLFKNDCHFAPTLPTLEHPSVPDWGMKVHPAAEGAPASNQSPHRPHSPSLSKALLARKSCGLTMESLSRGGHHV